jgi:putative oxidoreductase
MQRFFSTFPNGSPGMGLLLLRLALGGSLIAQAIAEVRASAWSQALPAVAEIPVAVLIIIGLWTPIAALAVCLLQLGVLLIAERTIAPQLLQMFVAVGLALLGPGAWSIDARLFGRRRVEIRPLREE